MPGETTSARREGGRALTGGCTMLGLVLLVCRPDSRLSAGGRSQRLRGGARGHEPGRRSIQGSRPRIHSPEHNLPLRKGIQPDQQPDQ